MGNKRTLLKQPQFFFLTLEHQDIAIDFHVFFVNNVLKRFQRREFCRTRFKCMCHFLERRNLCRTGNTGRSAAGRRGARVQGRFFGNELSLRSRSVLNQLLNSLRKTFLMDLLDTFQKLVLDLGDGHVYNVFNGALLRTLKTPWSGLVRGSKRTNDL